MAENKQTQSDWLDDAELRMKNRKWLRYSSNIARRILALKGQDNNAFQAELANTLGVSPQYISKIVKGKENLTLETIAKLSTALGVELISFPEYKYSRPVFQGQIVIKTIYTDNFGGQTIDKADFSNFPNLNIKAEPVTADPSWNQ
jgi:transcriptional regulator with XRE-family HTH domain